eukprot:7078615-Lingulodinium_polyedra.AAC.1
MVWQWLGDGLAMAWLGDGLETARRRWPGNGPTAAWPQMRRRHRRTGDGLALSVSQIGGSVIGAAAS